jgi:hypothetical protein
MFQRYGKVLEIIVFVSSFYAEMFGVELSPKHEALRFRTLRWLAFETGNCQPAATFINFSNVSIRTVRQLTQNPCYAVGFIVCLDIL